LSNIKKGNFTITKPSTKTNFINEYNSQIKSICIITGNPSFKSGYKEKNLRSGQSDISRDNFTNTCIETDISKFDNQSENQDHISNFRVQNIYSADFQEIKTSPQTIKSNYNGNSCVNKFEMLDLDDLCDSNNEMSLNTSIKQMVDDGNLELQNNKNTSISINSLNFLQPTNLEANTISINESIGDDNSATSEVILITFKLV